METSSQVSEHHQTSLWVLSIKSSNILINDPQSCWFIFIWVVMFERWGCRGVMLYFSLEQAGSVMLPECIGIVSLILLLLLPLLRVLSRPTDSSPPHITKEGLELQLSSRVSSLTDLGLKFKCWRQCWCCGEECGCHSGCCWTQRSRTFRSVKSSHCDQQASHWHHLPSLLQLGHKPGWPVFYPNDASLLGPIVSLRCSS